MTLLIQKRLRSFRALVGMLNWIVQTTRPDLYFDLVDLSTRFGSGTVEDLNRVRKILVKLKAEKSELVFPDLGSFSEWKIVAYTDASLGNLNSGVNSCGGMVVFLVNSDRAAAVSWRSGKIQRVVRSTMAAEGLSLSEGIDEAIYIQHILSEMVGVSSPIIGITDHEGLYKAILSTKLVDDRRLRIDIGSIKENIERGTIQEVQFTPSTEQLTDVLTKKGVHGIKLLSVLQTGKLARAF